MNKLYLTVSAIFLVLGAFVAWHTFAAGHVYAQGNETVNYHQNMMSNLTTDQAKSMIDTMKTHHGENWKAGCDKMMEDLNDST